MPSGHEPTGAVFLSYSHDDATPVGRIAEGLRAAGIEVWFDQSELRGGDAWDARIRRQIKACRLFLAVISANTESREKGYFRREWKLAVDCTHDLADDVTFLVPVAIDATAESAARVPEKFRDYQWTRLPEGRPTPAFIDHIKQLLGARAETAPTEIPPVAPSRGGGENALRPRSVTTPPRPPAAAAISPGGRRRPSRAWLLGCAAGVALLVAGAWLGRSWFPAGPRKSAPTTWLELGSPQGRFARSPSPAPSPDGRSLAFWAPDAEGRMGLWLRSLDTPVPRLLPGTFSKTSQLPPFWSPDGRSLGFFADNRLKRIDLAGGAPRDLARAANPRGGSWGREGMIVFVPAAGEGVYQVPASGGEAKLIAITPNPVTGFRWPHFLPDGRHFFVTSRSPIDGTSVFVASRDGGTAKPVLRVPSKVEYANGYLFFGEAGRLLAQRFNPGTMAVEGERVRVADNIGRAFGDHMSHAFGVSAGGTIATWSGNDDANTQLTWFNRKGERLGTVGRPAVYAAMALSPSETEVICERWDQTGADLWLLNVATGLETRFGAASATGLAGITPAWLPSGDRILYSLAPGLVVESLKGGAPERLTDDFAWLQDISRDGRFAIYERQDPAALSDLWILPLTGEHKVFPFVRTPAQENFARFSPDSRWVAFASDESGRPEIYLQKFPEPGRPVRVSREGGTMPDWRADGRELFFRDLNGLLMSAALDAVGEEVQVAPPTKLFATQVPFDSTKRQYQVSRDGERFLINTIVDDPVPRLLTVILNWSPENANARGPDAL